MKKFSLVGKVDLDKINVNNIKNLGPDRQVKAIRLWTDQNIKKYGRMGTNNTNEEMQKFIQDAADYFGLDTANLSFQRALKQQVGWGEEWKTKLRDKNGTQIDLDSRADLRDSTMQGALRKIIEDRGTGHHGDTQLGGTHGNYLHWRIGSNRIFGEYNRNGTFTLIGIGRHAGSGNSSYRIDLILGGTTTATTA